MSSVNGRLQKSSASAFLSCSSKTHGSGARLRSRLGTAVVTTTTERLLSSMEW